MKKISLIFCLILSLAFIGCASSKIEASSLSPVALLTVTGNTSLPWHTITDGKETSANQGLLQKNLDAKFFSDDPELAERYNRLDYAEEAFSRIFGEILDIKVLEKEAVIGSKHYRAMGEGLFHSLNTTITAGDYKDLRSPDKYYMRKLCSDLGAESCLVLSFEFFKKVVTGSTISGEITPYVNLKVKLYNKEGKQIFYKTYSSMGSQLLPTRGRLYDKEALVALYPEVIDSLLTKFAMEFIE